MKASSESGECASLISKVCSEVLEAAVVPDIVSPALSESLQTGGRPTFSVRPRGGDLSPGDGGGFQNGTSGGGARSGSGEKGRLRCQDLHRTWPGLNFRRQRLAHPGLAQKWCKGTGGAFSRGREERWETRKCDSGEPGLHRSGMAKTAIA